MILVTFFAFIALWPLDQICYGAITAALFVFGCKIYRISFNDDSLAVVR